MTATVPADDRGLLLGDGLFETILYTSRQPAMWQAHIDRLWAGCHTLGLPAPAPEALQAAGAAAIGAEPSGRAALRLTWTCGSGGRGLDRPEPAAPRLLASAAPAPMVEGPAALAVADIRRNEHSPASRLKSLAYLDHVLARREARAAGADEALMLNTAGEVAGCAAANLFWVVGDQLFTPALVCGVLAGVMRGEVLARAVQAGLRPYETRARLADLAGADALFITNSLIGVRPVSRLDDRVFAPDRRIAALKAALSDVS
ncbi:MAG TPA: aminotransferase class IV [Caulobacteraceae bacterium]|nr:aminotransferase class IV [Caulobacteraceae bacterium]